MCFWKGEKDAVFKVVVRCSSGSLCTERGAYGTTAPYFYATLDAAGFSDWIWYGPSLEHGVPAYHEVLSGEYGAAIYYDQVCGAMGWTLGSLDANEAVLLTVAFMFGTEQGGEALIELTKTSDIDPNETVGSEDKITYTICWENVSQVTAEDVVIVDYLPVGVTYPEGWDRLDPNLAVIPADPNYNQANHTYTWELGDVGSDDLTDDDIYNTHIELISKDYAYNPATTTLTGTWADDSTFNIQLLNQSGWDPVFDNIKFTVIPEPATLLLLGAGGLLLRRKWRA